MAFDESDFNKVKENLIQDFCLAKESKNLECRQKGYAFVIDVYDKNPQLALYKVSKYSSRCDILEKQPSREMLVKAVEEQGGTLNNSNIYDINGELRQWVEENLLCS